MKNTGKYFEELTGLIEHTLANKQCEVLLNHKLINKYGIEREIDVYIKTPKGNIVIECKDWRGKSNRIKMELIDAFYGKTTVINDVDRKIFVAKGLYQSGAKRLAEGLNIELFRLREINESKVLKWLEFDLAKKLHIDFSILHMGLGIINENNEKLYIPNLEGDTILYVEGEGNFSIDYIIKTNLEAYRETTENICFENYKNNNLKFWQEHLFSTNDKLMIYKYKGIDCKVLLLKCICNYEITSSPIEKCSNMSYSNEIKESVSAYVTSIQFLNNTEKLIFIKNVNSNKDTVFMEEINDGKKEQSELSHRTYTLNK